jgi:hypothetical protein
MSGQAQAKYNAAFAKSEPIWCYAIQAGDDGPIKIGLTRNPAQRIKTLQTANAYKLRGLAAWRCVPIVEKAFHLEFADSRLHGEWFAPTPKLLEWALWFGGDFEDWDS